MDKKVLYTINKYRMINPFDTVVIGVSGGIDSVCLLRLLSRFQVQLDFSIYVIHLHHGIRGDDADRDAKFVQDLCKLNDIPYEIVYRDIVKEAMEKKISVEEAGRNARYSLFEDRASRFKSAKIAVAHHKNDQAETIMHNIIRGSGLKGIGGMRPVRSQIIRPLFDCSKEEIKDYCKCNSIDYKEDYTNNLDDYTRNKIRLNLIPYVQENYNPNFVSGLCQMGDILREDEAYIQSQVEGVYKDVLIDSDPGWAELSIDRLLNMHPAIRKRVYRKTLIYIGASLKDIENKHINMIDELINYGTGKVINLPADINVSTVYERIRLSKSRKLSTAYEYGLQGSKEEIYIPECAKFVKINIFDRVIGSDFPKKIYTKWFDYDKIKENLSIRSRKTGDYILLKGIHDGQSGKKKLKDFFIDNKIPRHMRDEVPLVADGNNILWIVGYRISEYYKISNETSKILEVKFMEE